MNFLNFSAEVDAARLKDGRWSQPIVALESTIITHGMPYPQNLQVARDVEETVRANGAIPATIAVIRGKLHIGLKDAELEWLAQQSDVAKLSRAELPHCITSKKTGATTVAATMMAANHVGICVFATGGIGGVHRDAENTFDISADLSELAQTPVTVVSAGPKAILDIPKTLEVLETNGVPVIAVGQDFVPAFWSRTSDIPAPLRADTASEIAKVIKTRDNFTPIGGQLIANPIPAEAEIPAATIDPIIHAALTEAAAQGIHGKAVTPFLLDKIFHLTEGASLIANIALVKNNARLAAEIATELFTGA